MTKLSNLVTRFVKDEDGVALTEYLVLLGLITAAVIAAILLFGNNLASSFNEWATWISSKTGSPT